MSYAQIQYGVVDGVATLRFFRPRQLNAMNRAMMAEIIQAVS